LQAKAKKEGEKIISDAENEARETSVKIEEAAKDKINEAIELIIGEACT